MGTLFSLSKNKARRLILRASTSFENIIARVKQFIQLKPFNLSRIGEGAGIVQTLTSNNAFYRKGCYNNFNDSHYERLAEKVQKQSSEGSLCSTPTIPNKQTKNEKGKALCLFHANEDYKDMLTAAGEYHSVRNNPIPSI